VVPILAILALGLSSSCSNEEIDVAEPLYGAWETATGERAYAFDRNHGLTLSSPAEQNTGVGLVISIESWSAGAAWDLDDHVSATDASSNDLYFRCTSAGTGGSTEPAWPSLADVQAEASTRTLSDGAAAWTYEERPSISGTWTYDGTTLAIAWTNPDYADESGYVSINQGRMYFTVTDRVFPLHDASVSGTNAAPLGVWSTETGDRVYTLSSPAAASLACPLSSGLIHAPSWAASAARSVEDHLRIAVGSDVLCFSCTTAGTSGAAAPAWPSLAAIQANAAAGVVNDGAAVWTYQATPTITGAWAQTATSISVDWVNDRDDAAQAGTLSIEGARMRLVRPSTEAPLELLKQ